MNCQPLMAMFIDDDEHPVCFVVMGVIDDAVKAPDMFLFCGGNLILGPSLTQSRPGFDCLFGALSLSRHHILSFRFALTYHNRL